MFEGEAQDEKKNNCNDYDSDKPIATVLMVFTVCIIPADMATAYSSTDMEWTDGVEGGAIYIDDATGKITDCDAGVTSVNLSDKINGVSITSIGDSSFYYCKSLKSITFPNCVTSIGEEAFSSCSSLTSITITNL